MHAVSTHPTHSDVAAHEPLRIWLEHADGSIARGLIEALTREGALVRLVGDTSSIAKDEDVAVRISFSREAPTLPGSAHVVNVRPTGETTACELAWTHAGAARQQLHELVARG